MQDVVWRLKEWEVGKRVKEGLGRARMSVLDRVDRAVKFLEEMRRGYTREIVFDRVDPATKDHILHYIDALGLRFNQSSRKEDTLITIDVSPILGKKDVLRDFLDFLEKEKLKSELGEETEVDFGNAEEVAVVAAEQPPPVETRAALEELVDLLRERLSAVSSAASTRSLRDSLCPTSFTTVLTVRSTTKISSDIGVLSKSQNFPELRSSSLSKTANREGGDTVNLKKRRPGGLKRIQKGLAKVCRRALGGGGGGGGTGGGYGDGPPLGLSQPLRVHQAKEYRPRKRFSVLKKLKRKMARRRKCEFGGGEVLKEVMAQLTERVHFQPAQTEFLVYPTSLNSSVSSPPYQEPEPPQYQGYTVERSLNHRNHSNRETQVHNIDRVNHHSDRKPLTDYEMRQNYEVVQRGVISNVCGGPPKPTPSRPDACFTATIICDDDQDKKIRKVTAPTPGGGLCKRLAGLLSFGSGQQQLKQEIEKQRQEIELLKMKLDQCLINLSSIKNTCKRNQRDDTRRGSH